MASHMLLQGQAHRPISSFGELWRFSDVDPQVMPYRPWKTEGVSPSVIKACSSSHGPPYPGGLGPYTARSPDVKKPSWLRQRAPQGDRFTELKESLSTLKLNTVCEEAQCPNIGEV